MWPQERPRNFNWGHYSFIWCGDYLHCVVAACCSFFFGYFLLLCFYYGIVCCGRRKGCSFRLSVVFLAIYRIKRLWHGNVLPVFIIDDGYRKLQQLCGPNLAPHAVIIAEKLCFSFRCGFGITVWTINRWKKLKIFFPNENINKLQKTIKTISSQKH